MEVIKTQCRTTFRAETQGMTYGTEMGVRLRAVLARLHGKFEQCESETVCQQRRRHLWGLPEPE
eukprot:6760191-Karenia_brevis.AAC.1